MVAVVFIGLASLAIAAVVSAHASIFELSDLDK